MSFDFPEIPIPLYPSLAEEVGVEGAVLLTLYYQQLQRLQGHSQKGSAELILSREQWVALGRFWDEEQLAELTSVLVSQGYIDASFSHDGRVTVQWLGNTQKNQEALEVSQPQVSQPQVSSLPVMDDVPPPPPEYGYYPEEQDTPYYPDAPAPVSHPVENHPQSGPAPTFGGSIGWARKPRRGDELHTLFQQREAQNQQLHSMALGWQPSESFFALLPRHNIANQFAISCLDEFVLYWLDKDRKETNWDQKFLGWVKREWVKKQTQDGRQHRISNEQKAGFKNENARRDTREKRKRVTAAIMDIKDTDW